VSLLVNDGKERHIAAFDFHTVVYDLLNSKNYVANNVGSTDGDQLAHNMERSQRVPMPIKLQDIFANRRQKPSGPEEEVNCVLLLGNPGTGMSTIYFCDRYCIRIIGKTSLSKRLCHDWTTGK